MLKKNTAKKMRLLLVMAGVFGLGWVCAQQFSTVPLERMTFQVVNYRWVDSLENDERKWAVGEGSPARILIVTFKIKKPSERLDLFNVDFVALYKAGRQNWERSIGVAIRCIGSSPRNEGRVWNIPRQYGYEVGQWTYEEQEEYVEVGFLLPKDVTKVVLCVARPIGEISLTTPLSLTNSSNSGEPFKVEEPVAELVKNAQGAVVQVVAETDTGFSRGSGFIITEQGFIITSHHVVKSAKKIWVVVNGTDNLPAELVSEPKTDVDACLLRIQARRQFQPLPVAMNVEANNRIGQDVVVLGYPDGDPHLTVTRGLLAGFTSRNGIRCLKTTALVRKGNSGGPVLNMRGEVIGVLWQSEDSGFHYAILTDEIQNLVEYARRQSSRVNQTNPTAGWYTAWASR